MKNIKKLTVLMAILAVCLLGLVACAPTQLVAPTITLTDNVVSWEAVPFASGYDVYVGDKVENVSGTSYTITTTEVGKHQIKVVAKGDGNNYTDSPASNLVTYTVVKQAVKLDAPTITLTGNVVSWGGCKMPAVMTCTSTTKK